MIIKCKMCGGDLSLEEGSSIGTCEYCGSTMTVPSIDDEKLANLFNRANHFRMKSEFDKAAVSYENIIAEDESSAEAYWGLCLCKYGIEYVDDPASGEKKPTCHRTQFTSILEDSDYKQACDRADSVARRLYEREAEEIDRIQKQILEISSREEPFDIFICYKESDENGERTKDSVIAQDLYFALQNEGYKVFFARITLEDKLGTAYEPYIFAALNSAKVMIVLGTKAEHMNAVWVKNEWSRFLDMVRQGQKKMLIPAYRDMDPYDMPEEFINLQAQDMSKIGFMQDLIRGIGKVLNKGQKEKEVVREQVVVHGEQNGNATALIKRGNMALEDKEWERADEFFEQALNIDAECGEAYFGKLLAELKCPNMEEFAQEKIKSAEAVEGVSKGACYIDNSFIDEMVNKYKLVIYLTEDDIRKKCSYSLTYVSTVDALERKKNEIKRFYEENKIMNRAIRFAKGDFQIRLQAMCDKIEQELEEYIAEAKRKEEETIEKITIGYQNHLKEVQEKVEKRYYEGLALLEKEYNTACGLQDNANTAEEYDRVYNAFRKTMGYKDSWEQAEQCRKRAEQCRKRAEEIHATMYSQAMNALRNAKSIEEWEEAAEFFDVCGNYRDSVQQAASCRKKAGDMKQEQYCKAIDLKRSDNIDSLEKAIKILYELNGYKDSASLANECTRKIEQIRQNEFETKKKKYAAAVDIMNHQKKKISVYQWLKKEFDSLCGFEDSEIRALQCEEIIQKLERRKKKRILCEISAVIFVTVLVTSTVLIYKLYIQPREYREYYKQAEHFLEMDNKVAAVGFFEKSGGYQDAKQRIMLLANSMNKKFVAGGKNGIACVKKDGTVMMTGGDKEIRREVKTWENITAISFGYNHIVGLKSDGTVVAAGNNETGKCNVNEWQDIVAVSARYYHTVGLKSDGTLVAVGSDSYGAYNVNNWKDIVVVSASYNHTVGLKSDGTVVATGNNENGSCNVDDWEDVVAISTSDYNTVGLKSDGTVVAAGSNVEGQCDVDDWKDISAIFTSNYSTVGLKSDGTVVIAGYNEDGQYDDVYNWKDIVAVIAGTDYIVGVKSDGTVVATGENKYLNEVKKWTDILVE